VFIHRWLASVALAYGKAMPVGVVLLVEKFIAFIAKVKVHVLLPRLDLRSRNVGLASGMYACCSSVFKS